MKAILSGGRADGTVMDLDPWSAESLVVDGHEYRRARGPIADDWELRGDQMLLSWVHPAPAPSAPPAPRPTFQFRRQR